MIVILILTACSGGSGAIATPPGVGEAKVTSRGFACPEPEVPMQEAVNELRLLVRTEYISPEIQECFQLVYGIRIDRDEYSRNEEILGRLTAGVDYDLALAPDYIVNQVIEQGLLQSLDKSRLPLIRNLDADYLNFPFDPGNQYTLPYLAGTNAIVVNTDTVRNIPQSWADLWKPEYAGRMIFLDDSRTVIGATLLTLGYDVNTTDAIQLEQARVKLAELIPNIRLFDNDSPKTALISGAAELGITWTGEAFLAGQRNTALRFIFPTEGAIFWQDNWVVPANAQHTEAAYAWLNYTMQANMFWMMLRDFPYINPNRAALDYALEHHAEIYDAYMGSPITNIAPAVIVNSHRIGDVGEALPLYYRIWSELRGG
jgi:spermidine/putrescine-binding protein